MLALFVALLLGVPWTGGGAGSPATPAAVETVEELWSHGGVRLRYGLDDRGRRHGNYTAYYENGTVQLRARYRAGELEGTWASFYEDGSKHVYAKYRGGKLHGKWTERVPGGDLAASATYRDGLLDGQRTFYAEGKPIQKQRWREGRLELLDGVVAFPRTLEALTAELLGIRAVAPPEPEAKAPEAERLALERARGLNRLQEYRALCGLPWRGLSLEPDFDLHAQWGARLCHAIGRLDHTPANPGWPEEDYRRGYRGTSRSNLATTGDVARSIDMYMDDSDPSNIDRIGHRMHCLARTLAKTGFGSHGGYSAMWSMDRSGREPKVDVVAYPPAGYVPVDRFGARHAWSLSFAPGHRRVPPVEELSVRVVPLDERYAPAGPPLALDHLARLGSHTLVFRPVGLEVRAGARYWLEIEGLDGTKRDEVDRHLVEFVDLAAD